MMGIGADGLGGNGGTNANFGAAHGQHGKQYGGGGGGGYGRTFNNNQGANGGNGGRFGGGGGGYWFGNGGAGGDFGGGGGSDPVGGGPVLGGNGGFGGGGGGGLSGAGHGGFGAGGGGKICGSASGGNGGPFGGYGAATFTCNGNGPAGGGGGAALGAAIFVRPDNGASLTLTDCSADEGALTPGIPGEGAGGGSGSGAYPAVGGSAAASAFFLPGGSNIFVVTSGERSIAGSLGDWSASSATLVKAGVGILRLEGSNNYSGATFVNAGTLRVNGMISSSSDVIVSSVATIAGTGILSSLTLQSGSTLSPGASPGTLTASNTTWLGAGHYNWQLHDATGITGTGYDMLQVNGSLNVSNASGFKINLWTLSSTSPETSGSALNFNNSTSNSWTLVKTTGGILGFNPTNFLIITAAANGTAGFANAAPGRFWLTVAGNNLVLNYAAIPVVFTLSATNVTTTTATLNGTVNPNGTATSAYFQYGTNASYGNVTLITNLGSSNALQSVSLPLAGLTPGLTYHYRIVATNSAGTNVGSNITFTTLVPVPTVTTLAASNITAGSASLNATVNPNGTVTAAYFQYGTNTSYGSTTIATNLGSGSAGQTITSLVAGLQPGQKYHFRIVAGSNAGTNFGSDFTFTTLAGPPQVTTLPASNVTDASANLNALVNPNGLPTTSWFEWGIGSVYNHVTAASSIGSNVAPVAVSTALSGLKAGSAYHFRIVASNSFGLSRGSDQRFFAPVVTLIGAAAVTNGCLNPFTDPGATAGASPIDVAASHLHGVVIKADGSLVGWDGTVPNYSEQVIAAQLAFPASATNVIAMGVGNNHTLALKVDRSVIAWGINDYGQTDVPPGMTNVIAVAAGSYHSLALKANGTVSAWGWNASGQASVPANATNVIAIAASLYHSLALRSDGSLVGWGNNDFGQLNTPASATNIVMIACASMYSLALRADGAVIGWGNNNFGQTSIPESATNVIAIEAGNIHVLALRADGSLVAWGENYSGQTNVPSSVSNVVAMAAGNDFSLALREDGVVIAWGDNSVGQLNLPAGLATLPLPITISGTVGVTPGAYNSTYTATNSFGAIGTATRQIFVPDCRPAVTTLAPSNVTSNTATLKGLVNPKGSPTTAWIEWGIGALYGQTTLLTNTGNGLAAVSVSAGLSGLTAGRPYHYRIVASNSFGLTRGREQRFWAPAVSLNGSSAMTNLCPNVFIDPGAVVEASPSELVVSAYYGIALKADGSLTAWGTSGYSQTTIPASATNVIAVQDGSTHVLALRADGSLITWGGNNSYGQENIPASATNVVAIAVGDIHSLALKADGTVIGWGYNNFGQSTIPSSASNVVAIAGGMDHSVVLRADGSVFAWGDNTYGQTDIPANVTNVVAIAAQHYRSLALKADGTVIGWGSNGSGQNSPPVSATNVVAIVANAFSSVALKVDGSVIGWGSNPWGHLTIPASATNVVAIAGSDYNTMVIRADGSTLAWGYNAFGQTNIPTAVSSIAQPISVSGTVGTSPGIYTLTYRTTNSFGAVGIATRTVVVVCNPTLQPLITSPRRLGNGAFQFAFTNANGASFSVLTATNLSLPLTNWTILGPVTETSPGQFQFTDPTATNSPRRFYRVRSP
ncbi:MAG: autotransporter-associated beta strand repeat-containing protein [Akkermansiaceae bacterium]|nr:autotransporter-associated beta strand repeat-containing protein [Verrucomicrobiales bacterium]